MFKSLGQMHLFDQKYNEKSNIVFYHNLKYIFYFNIFCNWNNLLQM